MGETADERTEREKQTKDKANEDQQSQTWVEMVLIGKTPRFEVLLVQFIYDWLRHCKRLIPQSKEKRREQRTNMALSVRSLTLCLGIWSLVTSVASVISLQQLPDDSLHVTRHLSVYCLFTGALGIVGIVGAKQVRVRPILPPGMS